MACQNTDCITHLIQKFKDPKKADLVQNFLIKYMGLQKTSGADATPTEQAYEWLRWARAHPVLKVVTAAIPLGILPAGQTGLLYDVRVSTRGPDDTVFDNNAVIRHKVARGNCFLEIEKSSYKGAYCVIYALKKFTGGLGDDDDRVICDGHTWQRYFLKPLTEANSVVATRKANGEAAHLSAMKIGNECVLFGGSKNVHMAFKNKGDIKRYGNEQRYTVASEVNEAIIDLLDSMTSKDREM